MRCFIISGVATNLTYLQMLVLVRIILLDYNRQIYIQSVELSMYIYTHTRKLCWAMHAYVPKLQ